MMMMMMIVLKFDCFDDSWPAAGFPNLGLTSFRLYVFALAGFG